MNSLKLRLLCLWALSLAASVAAGFLMVQLGRQSTEAQVERAAAVVAGACDLIRDRYMFYVAGWNGPADQPDARLRADLVTVVRSALEHQDGVEGGIWQANDGPLAYAYPTYEGSGPKTDLPDAERAQIRMVNQLAARDEQPADRRSRSRAQTLLLHACPLGGPIPGLTGWTMIRVQTARGLQSLQLGLGVLFALMLIMTAWLGRMLVVWGRHVRAIEAALGDAGAAGRLAVARTGERELDRIIDALNEAGTKLAEARRESELLAARVSRAERLAGLGRIAAGVAHEIRNPIAAARLQGENALAGGDARRREAIGDMLEQIDRLDTLVSELLAMTQRVAPVKVPINLHAFLATRIAAHAPQADAKSVTIETRDATGQVLLDPELVGRVLDNLLGNAIRHAPEGGRVTLETEASPGRMTIIVADEGGGVPAEMAERLFEPFVTGRPDGTGLGLAIAREMADAHGGRLTLRRPGGDRAGRGAAFALELPQEDGWRPS